MTQQPETVVPVGWIPITEAKSRRRYLGAFQNPVRGDWMYAGLGSVRGGVFWNNFGEWHAVDRVFHIPPCDGTLAATPKPEPSPVRAGAAREIIAEILWNVSHATTYTWAQARENGYQPEWVKGCYQHADAVLTARQEPAPSLDQHVAEFLSAVRSNPGSKHPVKSYYSAGYEDRAEVEQPSWKIAEKAGWVTCDGSHRWTLTPLGLAVIGQHDAASFGLPAPSLSGEVERLTLVIAKVFSGMPERMAHVPVRAGEHHIGTLWSVSQEIAAQVLAALQSTPVEQAGEAAGIMCGGCGATSNSQRCIGCLHDFGTPDSAWVHASVSPSKVEGGK